MPSSQPPFSLSDVVPLPRLEVHVLIYRQHILRLQTGLPAYIELPAALCLLSVTLTYELANPGIVTEGCQRGLQRVYTPAWVHANFQLGRDKKQAFLAQHAVWKVCLNPDSCCNIGLTILSLYLPVTCRRSRLQRRTCACTVKF